MAEHGDGVFFKDGDREVNGVLSPNDKLNLYRGMLLTRACDNALKKLFLSGEMLYEGKGFQGKGFRSLGQEAIYGAPFFLNTGQRFKDGGNYFGDVAAPMIRDLGVFLAMTGDDVETAINAQAGKCGKPCDGRDLHLGDFEWGVLPPAAPLAIATCTIIGMALSFKRLKAPRVAVSFIGDGGTSLGEWHEAINFAAVLKLPMIFCIENNQIALSTPLAAQTAAMTFSDKAVGYGLPSIRADGNDIESIALAFRRAAAHARAGQGPMLIELSTMRMCGHAHHDDMLYIGYDPKLDLDIPPLKAGGYADGPTYELWRKRCPIRLYRKKLKKLGLLADDGAEEMAAEAVLRVREAVEAIKKRPWPRFNKKDDGLVFSKPWIFKKRPAGERALGFRFSPGGFTYLQGIAQGLVRALIKHDNCIVLGEDVAPPYGNAFMMFKDCQRFAHRFINTPISENAIVGACVGMALSGHLPIGEMQFNDFVACAMDQVVNNAAKTYFRLGLNVPMVLRMPYGGLRRAGPFHSQDTSPWFYRSFGLKIMAPSSPLDAMRMLVKAVQDPDPVLFYEHIALYRDPRIKQDLSWDMPEHCFEGAALRREGPDLTMIGYGAYAHAAERAAEVLSAEHDIHADVIDLRYLAPLDLEAIFASVTKTSRVMLIGEDGRSGSILESIASKLAQELFAHLDAPIMVLGSRETPVPYAPSLEDDYLLSEQRIVDQAIKLKEY